MTFSFNMQYQRHEKAGSPASKPRRQNRALHEYMRNPFRSCMAASEEEDNSQYPLLHDVSQETSCFLTPPGSQAPTVVGSVSDHSIDSGILDRENETKSESYEEVPSSVDQQTESFVSEASLGSDQEEDLDFEPQNTSSFFMFRMSYLFVTTVVMLADGLQGMIRCQFMHKTFIPT